MKQRYLVAILLFVAILIIDQYVKMLFVNGLEYEGECLSFVLAYNYGVAFSMFAFLAEYLKYIQIALLLGGAIYLLLNKSVLNYYLLPVALLYAGGIGNIIDRFVHGAVVDYVYWHCGFEFAIFNLADVIIDLAVVLIIWFQFKSSKKEKAEKNNTHLGS
ncbi:signal peptidase II [Candidatus Marinarcus aquaticus]|uniref:Lipoprotein signal peptidase n=1 Tax=Candidatus Marinarcus aquaticus TaxID=2044504 RepID=A0A4Q0XS64_9BACT|nr:signal peptidase II [Candidatus Marinarcus aquaticus]RXJ57897.1 signal peptidase II [Candidatus Marinarcus aquaticus]